MEMKGRKKVVFLFRDMGTGGAQKIEAFVANTLYEEDYEVIAVNMASTACSVNIDPNIRIVDVIYDGVAQCQNKWLRKAYQLVYLLKLKKTLLSLQPDIVCAFLSDVVRIAILAIGNHKIPVIGSERGDPYKFTKKQFLNYKKAYTKCNSVVFQLENVAKKYDLPSSVNQKVIPNPCIPRKKAYAARSATPDKVIISAGRLAEQKRFDLLIDAFALVHERFPEYKLHIYGDGPLKEQLRLQAKEYSVESAIVFEGDVDDVFAVATNAEFFVLSSDFEGIPNVLIEAMATGIPCISTDCSPGGARYLLKDGERGLIVPRNDKEKLAEAMMQYIGDPQLGKLHSEKGLCAIDEFAPQTIKKMWLEIFERV